MVRAVVVKRLAGIFVNAPLGKSDILSDARVVVLRNEEVEQAEVKFIPFLKSRGFAGETRETLAQGIKETLDIYGISVGLTDHLIRTNIEDRSAKLP